MTQSFQPQNYPPPTSITEPPYSEPTYSDGDSSGGTADVVKDQASQFGQGAAEAGQHVADVAQDQATAVVSEAGRQAKDLLRQAQSELAEQAAAQQQRVAAGLRSLGEELTSMSEHDGDRGVAADLAKQAAGRAEGIAGWLDEREPGQLLSEVRSFARERPVAFLAIAFGAGVVTARLGRGLAGASSDDEPSGAPLAPPKGLPAQATHADVESSVSPVGASESTALATEGFGAVGRGAAQLDPNGGTR